MHGGQCARVSSGQVISIEGIGCARPLLLSTTSNFMFGQGVHSACWSVHSRSLSLTPSAVVRHRRTSKSAQRASLSPSFVLRWRARRVRPRRGSRRRAASGLAMCMAMCDVMYAEKNIISDREIVHNACIDD